MDPVTLALVVGLGSGVVGGAVSQLVAGAFKTHGDTRQITAAAGVAKAAETRWEREQAFEREKLLADQRRELFIRTAHALQRMRERINGREEEIEEHSQPVWEDAVTHRADALFELETEIRILAPTLTNTVRAATKTARIIRDIPPSTAQPEIDRLKDEYLKYTMDSITRMRMLLGTEPDDPAELPPAEQGLREGWTP